MKSTKKVFFYQIEVTSNFFPPSKNCKKLLNEKFYKSLISSTTSLKLQGITVNLLQTNVIRIRRFCFLILINLILNYAGTAGTHSYNCLLISIMMQSLILVIIILWYMHMARLLYIQTRKHISTQWRKWALKLEDRKSRDIFMIKWRRPVVIKSVKFAYFDCNYLIIVISFGPTVFTFNVYCMTVSNYEHFFPRWRFALSMWDTASHD